MLDPRWWSPERVAGFALTLGSAVQLPGLLMFWIRGGQRGGQPPTPGYYAWERGFILAAVLVTVLGFALLDAQLQNTGGRLLARAGVTAYLFAGVLGVAAEALNVARSGHGHYPLIVVYVVLAFLAQAALGGALLQAGWLRAWVGWLTILWNLAWLIVLPLVTARDIYFPVLHHVTPLIIGLALLWRAP
jgi:hypothetical protein